jgi:septum formation protein
MNGMSLKKLILASSSIYRRELLERLKIPFAVESPDIDETPFDGEKPEDTALRLAEQKAKKVALRHPDALVIGCDQVAVLDGMQIGKPYTFENAFAQLKTMRGRKVIFHSALCLYNGKTGRMQSTIVPYAVTFRNYSDERIRNYLEKEAPYHCAGSAKSEGLGIVMIASMEGDDPNALIGLPLIALVTMIENEGIEIV